MRPDDLAASVIRAAVDRAGVDEERIEEVVFGCANQAGEDNRNVARMAALLADLPQHVGGVTVNRLCASGLQAIASAARSIRCGEGDVFVAGGVESMTRAPYALPKNPEGFGPSGNVTAYDTSLGWRFPNPALATRFPLEAMGETAENIVERSMDGSFGGPISRQDQDRFALASHERATAAADGGRFDEELVPVEVRSGDSVTVVTADEGIRRATTLEALGRLRPAFRAGGTVTAGNSSSLNDGASALVLASRRFAEANGLRPLGRVVAGAAAGVDPRLMGIGPVAATRKLLGRLGLGVEDIDLVELNEAFAAQAIASIRELRLDPERVNSNGGAIALGHPLGCSGARMVTTLVHELQRRALADGRGRLGLATMCVGVGQGESLLIEVAP